MEIHIYGYGKFEDVDISNVHDLTVFYGANEAGKSTIMSFIHSILFGFPTKQQSELRYEPKKGAKYGGKLIVEFENTGQVAIERVKGKATGDVSVFLPDGTQGGEERLKQLIKPMDKTLYQSIFSFNLHGLQNVHQLRSEDLGKFLFSTGTVGSDRLLLVDNHLDKELSSLFKQGGQKPLINSHLKEVKKVYDDLKRAEKQNDQYRLLLEKKKAIYERIQLLQEKVHHMQKKLHKLDEWEKYAPYFLEKKMLQKELEPLKELTFPIDGIERLDQMNQWMKPLQGQMATLQEKIKKLEEELEEIPPHDILEREEEIQTVLEKLPLYDKLLFEERQMQSELERIDGEIEEWKEKLHVPISEEKILTANTSIFMKERVLKAAKKQERLNEQKEELDLSFEEEQQSLEKWEQRISDLKDKLLSNEERKDKEEKLSKIENKEMVQKELQYVQDAILREKASLKQKKFQTIQCILFIVLFLLFTIVCIWRSSYVLAGASLLGFLFFLVFLLRVRKQHSEKDLKKLTAKEEKLLSELKETSTEQRDSLKKQLELDKAIREQLKNATFQWEISQERYEKIIQSYENWEREYKENEMDLLRIAEELNLPREVAFHYPFEAFQTLEQLKNKIRERNHLLDKLENKRNVLKQIDDEWKELTSAFIEHASSKSLQEQAVLLKNKLKGAATLKVQYEERKKKLKDLKEQLEMVTQQWSHLRKEKEQLFSLANVETEEQFRLEGKKDEKRRGLLNKIEERTRQLELFSLSDNEIKEFLQIDDILTEKEETKEQLNVQEQEIRKLQETLAETKHEISRLEEGGVYSQLLHSYEQEKSELDYMGKEWAKFAIAKRILQQTVERFKQAHLPKMLEQAEQYFYFLTDGQYVKIFPKQDTSGFLIERQDHLLFEANELSQATTEQLYVSIRLSLAATLYKRFSFPIMIDDSFVNFDHIRTEKMIQLLRNFRNNQILFFTCHKHLLHYFDDHQIVLMNKFA